MVDQSKSEPDTGRTLAQADPRHHEQQQTFTCDSVVAMYTATMHRSASLVNPNAHFALSPTNKELGIPREVTFKSDLKVSCRNVREYDPIVPHSVESKHAELCTGT